MLNAVGVASPSPPSSFNPSDDDDPPLDLAPPEEAEDADVVVDKRVKSGDSARIGTRAVRVWDHRVAWLWRRRATEDNNRYFICGVGTNG